MTSDHKYSFGNNRLAVGVACTAGGCSYMQDAFLVNLDANITKSLPDLVGICDGHGPDGEGVSEYICNNIAKIIRKTVKKSSSNNISQCLKKACIAMDKIIFDTRSLQDFDGFVHGGSTCNIVLVGNKYIYCCNIGDSRGIISVSGKAKPISVDHKPPVSSERTRIKKAGGFVKNGRVNGELGVSRAFGDFVFKANAKNPPELQFVTCIPDVTKTQRKKNIDFIVIASDGVWDNMSNQEVVDFILGGMHDGKALDDICWELVQDCFVPTVFSLGSDNATILVAQLL